MKTTVIFKDAKGNKVVFNAKITERNGYPEFTASGEYCGGIGQCFDEVDPATDSQTKLIEIWRKWHLNGRDNPLPSDFEDKLTELIETIEQEEEERAERLVTDEDIDLFNDFDEPETALALALICGLSVNEIDNISEDGNNYWTVQGVSYLAGTDDEMNEAWDEELDRYIDECIEIPAHIEPYFDRERWKNDAKSDGRGHALNHYNGDEEEAEINGMIYYAYRQ